MYCHRWFDDLWHPPVVDVTVSILGKAGFVLFTIPLLIGIGWAYLTIVFVSIFELGGEFWKKLLSIFRHQSRVVV